ncbi:MAG: methyltransferase domain-containing protein [Terriglobales bacterium]
MLDVAKGATAKVRSLFGAPVAAHERDSARSVAANGAGILRHSNGLRDFLIGWDKVEGRRVLDLGRTSSANLSYFTERGHSVYSDDLLHEAAEPAYLLPPPPETPAAPPVFDSARWLRENLDFPAERFDAVLLWDLVDYMPEALVKPLLERLTLTLRPGGAILSYFHTRDAGADAAFFRYHIHDQETLELRPGTNFRLQRIFNNRHVENLFKGYRSVKFFLARDNLREVLATK